MTFLPGFITRLFVLLLASIALVAGGAFSQAEAQRYTHGHPGGGKPPDHGGGHDGGRKGGGVSIDTGAAIMLGIGAISAIQRARQSRKEPEPVYKKPPPRKVLKPQPTRSTPQQNRNVRRTPPAAEPRVATPALQTDYRNDEILVSFESSQPDSVADAVASRHGLTRLDAIDVELVGVRVQKYRINDGRSVQQVASALAADSDAGPVQYNFLYRLNGPAAQANATGQYSLMKLAVGPAHEIATGNNVRVAVIDTGIDRSHPALQGNIAEVFDAVQDGRAAIHAHGTAIAGLIAGQDKVQGIAPAAKILAIRAFHVGDDGKTPETSSFILLRAFDWAAKHDAKIFNMSFAGPADRLVEKALRVVRQKGAVLVAAAGNGGADAPPAYPAAYQGVIAITALDHKDRLYKGANQGAYVAVAAPGVDILVPAPMKRYSYSSGTSLAAAHISGVVALLLERQPQADADTIARVIAAGAHDLGPKGHDPQFGAGRADAMAALTMISTGRPAAVLTSQR